MDSFSDDKFLTLYGTRAYHEIWEKMCAQVFDNKLDTKVSELNIGLDSDEKLIDIIEKPKWIFDDFSEEKDTFIPDLITIDDEKELYNKFDETQLTLDDKVVSYIEKNLYKKKLFDNLIIKIKSNNNVDTNKFTKAFKQYLNDRIELNQRLKNFNRVKQLRLFIIGLMLIIFSIIIGTVLNSIIYTIISTIGSFAIWETSNIWIIENMDSKVEKRILKSLLKAQIEII